MHRLSFVLLFAATVVYGQGTFLYDQQSSDESGIGEGYSQITSSQPFGQSFTPSLAGVGFVRLLLYDAQPTNSTGATIFVELRSNLTSGSPIASTAAVFVPNGTFGGFVDFFFPTNTPVTSGATYFFHPVVQSGDSFALGPSPASMNYPGGMAYYQGLPDPLHDLWFREGIIIPQPCSISILALGLGSAFYMQRRGNRK